MESNGQGRQAQLSSTVHPSPGGVQALWEQPVPSGRQHRRVPRLRVALAWAALQGRRSATALRVAQPQALGAFPARQVGAACTAFTQAGEIARLQPYAAITRIGARDGPVVPARTVCRKLGVESRYRIHIAFLLTGTAFASDGAYASPAAMRPFTNFSVFPRPTMDDPAVVCCSIEYRARRTKTWNGGNRGTGNAG